MTAGVGMESPRMGMGAGVSAEPPPDEWTPRMWQGMRFSGWLRQLASHHFAVRPAAIPIAAMITLSSMNNSLLRLVQRATIGPKIAATPIHPQPVFILGHWRTGTTLLHELLALDPRHTSPNTYQCLCPNHFALTESFLSRRLAWMLPSHRPSDRMPVLWSSPQEDEFALCNLGLPSWYIQVAFPKAPPLPFSVLNIDTLPARDQARWKRGLMAFLKEVHYRRPGRLVVKSPTHTCRVPALLEMFPEARFVHLTRHPAGLFSSTVHLWRSLVRAHGMQGKDFPGIEERVLETLKHMHARFEATRDLIPAGRMVEFRFEDFVGDRIGSVRRIYNDLDLGDFEPARPAIEAYLAQTKQYQRNRYTLDAAARDRVMSEWRGYAARHGYDR